MDSVREMRDVPKLTTALSREDRKDKSAFNKSMLTILDHRQRGTVFLSPPSQSLSNVLEKSPAFAPEVRDPVTPGKGKIIKDKS